MYYIIGLACGVELHRVHLINAMSSPRVLNLACRHTEKARFLASDEGGCDISAGRKMACIYNICRATMCQKIVDVAINMTGLWCT